MTDESPTPVDPARVRAVLEVLGWPDDRQDDNLPGLFWDLAEDVIRAADAAGRHLMEHRGGRWEIEHPAGCAPGCPVDRAALRHGIDASLTPKPGRYEVDADLGGGFQLFERVDLEVRTDG